MSVSTLHIRSLYLKVVIPIVALVLAGMGAVSFFAMTVMGESVRLVAEQRGRYGLAYVRRSLADVAGQAGEKHNRDLQNALERLGESPDIDAARILSETGKVLASSSPAEVGTIMPAHLSVRRASTGAGDTLDVSEDEPDVLHAIGPLPAPACAPCPESDPDRPAFADVEISLSRQSAGMRTWGEMAAAIGVAQFTSIGVGIVLILGIVVVRPIRRLSSTMNQVQGGDLEVTAVPPGTIEIDELVSGFNDMVARLQRAREVEQDAQRNHLARVEQLATLGEVAASLAHEIRNPLSGSKAAIDVLAGEETEEEPRRILKAVSAELARVDEVVRQLLRFARPKAPPLARVDLRTLLDDAVLLSGPRASAQGATLEVERGEEPLEVMADADMVRQVIVNLVINALQALQGEERAGVTLSAAARGGEATCSIRDTGPGVPADRAETIFRPFMTTKAHGTGLGLATSRRLIEAHGGRLWLDQTMTPGACFTFTLPLFTDSEPNRA